MNIDAMYYNIHINKYTVFLLTKFSNLIKDKYIKRIEEINKRKNRQSTERHRERE